jgi:L-2-amino-thiazoline-4-carboxylic acid hydrolase
LASFTLETLLLISRLRLPKIVGRDMTEIVNRSIRQKGPARLAQMQRATASIPASDFYARRLQDAFLLAALMHESLHEQMEPERADEAFMDFLHGLLKPIFAMGMRPLPKGPEAFELFKKRYIKANKPLTLMTWEVVEDTPTSFQADFSRCGYAELSVALDKPDLCPFFCAYDQVFFDTYDRRVKFIREKKLADGDDKCTFRFEFK